MLARDASDPAFSPSGRQVAFQTSDRDATTSDIFVADTRGGERRLVVQNGFDAAWSSPRFGAFASRSRPG
jgi:Tol biopolymer transport system component